MISEFVIFHSKNFLKGRYSKNLNKLAKKNDIMSKIYI